MLELLLQVQVITSYGYIKKYTPETLSYNVDASFIKWQCSQIQA